MHNLHAREFRHLSGEINALYHELAVKIGVSDSVLNIFYVLFEKDEPCLQRDIFRLTGMSRQTINSAIRNLEKEGLVFLEQGPGRNTIVRTTEKGRKFAAEHIYPMFEMENQIWDAWTEEEQAQYLTLTQKYRDSLKDHIRERM